jgi:hydroxymethylbilane synthase
MNAAELRLGTRGSQLALWQAQAVAARIEHTSGRICRIVVIRTSGDRLQEAPLSEVGGKRLFVKEIEDALLREEIDLAVHSSKDMPALLPEGLAIGAVLRREDPLDAIVLPDAVRLKTGAAAATMDSGTRRIEGPDTFNEAVAALGETASIGTSSVRRIAQLMRLFPRARFLPIRGNLDTRLRKLDRGEYDAIVLAAAGLSRLGMASRISARVPVSVCVPAPGQGIVAIEIRDKDPMVTSTIRLIDDHDAHFALDAERAVVESLGGGCQTPIGALASSLPSGDMELVAVVVSLDGRRSIPAAGRGRPSDAKAIGARVGAQLLAGGAGEILAEAERSRGAVEGIQP